MQQERKTSSPRRFRRSKGGRNRRTKSSIGRSQSSSSPSNSPERQILNTPNRSPSPKGLLPTKSVASASNLQSALADLGPTGAMMHKLLDSTSRYRPGRDTDVMKAFENRHIDYDIFRSNLYSIFWIKFNDEEYKVFTQYFDPQEIGVLDGYEFKIAFTRLAAMRKEVENLQERELFEVLTNKKNEMKQKRIELFDSQMDIPIILEYNEETYRIAMNKLTAAAKKFDPYHPASPSLESFSVAAMNAITFREMLKRTFNLKLDGPQFGAIIDKYIVEKPKGTTDLIGKSEIFITPQIFLRDFLKIGQQARDKDLTNFRQLQKMSVQRSKEEIEKKRLDIEAKMSLQIDNNYTNQDELNAIEKMRESSTKYDKNAPGSVALDGFECESLSPNDFKDLVARCFNLFFNTKEMGYIMNKYDQKGTGRVTCKPFLNEFMKLGQENRHKLHLEQLEKQRQYEIQQEIEHQKKMLEVKESEKVNVDFEFTNYDLQSGLNKITDAAIHYNSIRGVNLSMFEPKQLDPREFNKALKKTFNLKLLPKELGAVIHHFDKSQSNCVNCQAFLNEFIIMGSSEKAKIRSEKLKAQREAVQNHIEDNQNKILHLASSVSLDSVTQLSIDDKESALIKLTEAAKKYDVAHPAAMSLDGFDIKYMSAGEFKELVRRTFNLKLNLNEVAALFQYFGELNKNEDRKSRSSSLTKLNLFSQSDEQTLIMYDTIDCGVFLKRFLTLGIEERAKDFTKNLKKQEKENKIRHELHQKKLQELTTRGNFQLDKEYDEEDKSSIIKKMTESSEMLDKNHPSTPSLQAFEVANMPIGLFRENIKKVFNIQATAKEMGYLFHEFGKPLTTASTDEIEEIDVQAFLLRYQFLGQEIRNRKKAEFLKEKRETEKQMRKKAEEKINALWDKAELKIDFECTADDQQSAIDKLTQASIKYDKMHAGAPNLDGFTGGPIKPGVFRELLRRAFNVSLTPKELASIVLQFPHTSNAKLIDGKQFLIQFMKYGFDARSRIKNEVLEKQRKYQIEMKQHHELKMKELESKHEIRINVQDETLFQETDKLSAFAKITHASAMYDKNLPGCVPLTAFTIAYMTPAVFREVIKKTFNVTLTIPEVASFISEFHYGDGNLDCAKFLVHFIKTGTEERQRIKSIQLEKQRLMYNDRKTFHERKMKELEAKLLMNIDYKSYNKEQKESAFQKLAAAAKRYDKNHPAAMALDGFEEKSLKPHVFREMLKRTFNIILEPPELIAVMHYFDKKETGSVSSKKFLIHFLKLGIAERENDHKMSLQKLREDKQKREKDHLDRIASQWAKLELNLTFKFTENEKKSAMDKLTDASVKFDPASPGPMGLTAFEAATLSPATFREMLKRSFNMMITNGELAALIDEFDTEGNHQINCSKFMVTFTTLGFEKRSEIRTQQLKKQRDMIKQSEQEMIQKKKEADEKIETGLDLNYSNDDFHSALEKIRFLASHYDRSHPSAPSLQGFVGNNMKPIEFKQMMMRTFQMNFTSQELGALLNYFPVRNDKSRSPSREEIDNDDDEEEEDGKGTKRKNHVRSSRSKERNEATKGYIDNIAFLNYFNKIQRDEQSKRNTERIQTERELKLKQQIYHENLANKKRRENLNQLQYTKQDEESLVEKFIQAADHYNADPAVYNAQVQGFKGPTLPPGPFRDIFQRIFLIRLSLPEMGVLLSILDPTGTGLIDGAQFIKWFYKITRNLWETGEDFDINYLRWSGGGMTALLPTTLQPDPTPSTTKPSTSTSTDTSTKTIKIKEKDLNIDDSLRISTEVSRPSTYNKLFRSHRSSQPTMSTSSVFDEFNESEYQPSSMSVDQDLPKETSLSDTLILMNKPSHGPMSSSQDTEESDLIDQIIHNLSNNTMSLYAKNIHTASYLTSKRNEKSYHKKVVPLPMGPSSLPASTESTDLNPDQRFTHSTVAQQWILPHTTTQMSHDQTPAAPPSPDGEVMQLNEKEQRSYYEMKAYLTDLFQQDSEIILDGYHSSELFSDPKETLHPLNQPSGLPVPIQKVPSLSPEQLEEKRLKLEEDKRLRYELRLQKDRVAKEREINERLTKNMEDFYSMYEIKSLPISRDGVDLKELRLHRESHQILSSSSPPDHVFQSYKNSLQGAGKYSLTNSIIRNEMRIKPSFVRDEHHQLVRPTPIILPNQLNESKSSEIIFSELINTFPSKRSASSPPRKPAKITSSSVSDTTLLKNRTATHSLLLLPPSSTSQKIPKKDSLISSPLPMDGMMQGEDSSSIVSGNKSEQEFLNELFQNSLTQSGWKGLNPLTKVMSSSRHRSSGHSNKHVVKLNSLLNHMAKMHPPMDGLQRASSTGFKSMDNKPASKINKANQSVTSNPLNHHPIDSPSSNPVTAEPSQVFYFPSQSVISGPIVPVTDPHLLESLFQLGVKYQSETTNVAIDPVSEDSKPAME